MEVMTCVSYGQLAYNTVYMQQKTCKGKSFVIVLHSQGKLHSWPCHVIVRGKVDYCVCNDFLYAGKHMQMNIKLQKVLKFSMHILAS